MRYVLLSLLLSTSLVQAMENLQKIEQTVQNVDKERENCPICLDPITKLDAIRTLACKHVLHNTCYSSCSKNASQSKSHFNCRVCRTRVKSFPTVSQTNHLVEPNLTIENVIKVILNTPHAINQFNTKNFYPACCSGATLFFSGPRLSESQKIAGIALINKALQADAHLTPAIDTLCQERDVLDEQLTHLTNLYTELKNTNPDLAEKAAETTQLKTELDKKSSEINQITKDIDHRKKGQRALRTIALCQAEQIYSLQVILDTIKSIGLGAGLAYGSYKLGIRPSRSLALGVSTFAIREALSYRKKAFKIELENKKKLIAEFSS